MQRKDVCFPKINPFDLKISYQELDAKSPANVHDNHIHNECEIYINLSGNVSFSVENALYPIMPGNVVITRPFEYHHCIYHSNQLHKHFGILFDPAGNEKLLDIFYKREVGKNNLLILDTEKTAGLIQLCHRLNSDMESETEKYCCFFEMMNLLNHSVPQNMPPKSNDVIIANALDYIYKNLSRKIAVTDIAKECYVSVSTLERRFLQAFNLLPTQYIQKRRLANALRLLSDGTCVTDSAIRSGFSDCSKFIEKFKKAYGMTPFKYKKSLNNKNY